MTSRAYYGSRLASDVEWRLAFCAPGKRLSNFLGLHVHIVPAVARLLVTNATQATRTFLSFSDESSDGRYFLGRTALPLAKHTFWKHCSLIFFS